MKVGSCLDDLGGTSVAETCGPRAIVAVLTYDLPRAAYGSSNSTCRFHRHQPAPSVREDPLPRVLQPQSRSDDLAQAPISASELASGDPAACAHDEVRPSAALDLQCFNDLLWPVAKFIILSELTYAGSLHQADFASSGC
jgi:hypothetical protein